MRSIVTPPGSAAIYREYGYSPAIRAGGFLFVSGQVGVRADGSAPADPAEQMDLAFANLGAVLAAAGGGFDSVVDLIAFYRDYPAHGPLARAIRERHFGTEAPPTWTAVGVAALAEPFVFELKATAWIGDQPSAARMAARPSR